MGNIFDMDKWFKNIDKYLKNKQGIGFEAKISMNEGTPEVKLSNLPPKYHSAVRALIRDISSGILQYAFESYHLPFVYGSNKDEELEAQITEDIKSKENYFFAAMFEQGPKPCVDFIDQSAYLFQLKYALNHIRFDGEHWIHPNGNRWDTKKGEYGAWTDKEGIEQFDIFSTTWEYIMNPLKSDLPPAPQAVAGHGCESTKKAEHEDSLSKHSNGSAA